MKREEIRLKEEWEHRLNEMKEERKKPGPKPSSWGKISEEDRKRGEKIDQVERKILEVRERGPRKPDTTEVYKIEREIEKRRRW
jgi:hypothetical protein